MPNHKGAEAIIQEAKRSAHRSPFNPTGHMRDATPPRSVAVSPCVRSRIDRLLGSSRRPLSTKTECIPTGKDA